MIVAAAICPPAPLLVPGVAPRLAADADECVQACCHAVAWLAGVDRIVVLSVGAGPSAGRTLSPGDVVTATGFLRSDVADGGRDATAAAESSSAVVLPSGAPEPPAGPRRLATDALPATGARPVGPSGLTAGTVVAAHLLRAAGIGAPTYAVQIGGRNSADRARALLDPGLRTGLLVMGNGAACHGEHAPGGDDPRAGAFDDQLVEAVASGDPGRLADTCRSLAATAADLRADTLPAFDVMAHLVGAATGTPVTAATGTPVTAATGTPPANAHAEILHYSAKLGIGYLVATWLWE